MTPLIADLRAFAALELRGNDIEPWAEVIGALALPDEERLWVTKLYNAYDDLGSAWSAYLRWPDPWAWHAAPDRADVAQYPCGQERRNLRGGRIIRHLDSYVDCMEGLSQRHWLESGLGDDALDLMAHLRQVWGTGRQSAFEWAEFVAKVAGFPVDSKDGALWESSGPRAAIEMIYGPAANTWELTRKATWLKDELARAGVELSWWDFETVVCDFKVMTRGRYYPGQHIQMIKEEIEGVAGRRAELRTAFYKVIPEPWCDFAPGVDRGLRTVYRDMGVVWNPVP